jgi:hypothetical protein
LRDGPLSIDRESLPRAREGEQLNCRESMLTPRRREHATHLLLIRHQDSFGFDAGD